MARPQNIKLDAPSSNLRAKTVVLNPKTFKGPIPKDLFTRLYFYYLNPLNENSESATIYITPNINNILNVTLF